MFTLILSLVFVLVAVIAMGIGALTAKKKAWQLTVTKIVLSLISALLAALVASLVAKLISGILVGSVLTVMFGELITALPSGQEIVTALVAMILAPVLFLIFYGIIRGILSIFKKLIARPFLKLTEKKAEPSADASAESLAEDPAADGADAPMDVDTIMAKMAAEEKKKDKKSEFKLDKNNWISALCGALCGLVTLCILLIPMVGTLGIVNDVAAMPLQTAAETDDSGFVSIVADALDGTANNAGSVVVKYTGGQLLYDAMTTYTVGGQKATLRNETEFIGSVAGAIVALGDEDLDKTIKADSFRQISVAFDSAVMTPKLIAELTSAAADDWRHGNAFAGVSMPDMGPLNPIMTSLVDAFAQGTDQTIKEDLDSVVEIIAVLIENDAMGSLAENPLIMLSNEQISADILFELLNNPRLYVMVDGLSDFGMGMLLDAVGVVEDGGIHYEDFRSDMSAVIADTEGAYAALYEEVFNDYGVELPESVCASAAAAKLSGNDFEAWIDENIAKDRESFAKITAIVSSKDITDGTPEIQNKENESAALAHAFAVIYGLTDDMDGDDFDVKGMLVKMGAVLDSLAKTETYGPEKTGMILTAMLQSDMVHDEMGFSVLEATEAAASINENSAAKGYVALMNSLSLVVDALDASTNTDINNIEAVQAMLNDLTPESAQVLSSIATPAVMKNYGVPDKSSEPVSDFMGRTFTNLADAKAGGMPDDEYARESAAVSNLMNMVMASGDGAVFGDDSATGTTAKGFVQDISGSKVMSETIVQTVYEDGEEPINDPLVSERKMSDEEKADFVNALNEEWESSEKTAEDKKEIIAIAAIMNVQVDITLDGVELI